MNHEEVDQALFELYLEGVDNDVQKIERQTCQEHFDAAVAEMRLKYGDLLHDGGVLAPTEYEMLRYIMD